MKHNVIIRMQAFNDQIRVLWCDTARKIYRWSDDGEGGRLTSEGKTCWGKSARGGKESTGSPLSYGPPITSNPPNR